MSTGKGGTTQGIPGASNLRASASTAGEAVRTRKRQADEGEEAAIAMPVEGAQREADSRDEVAAASSSLPADDESKKKMQRVVRCLFLG